MRFNSKRMTNRSTEQDNEYIITNHMLSLFYFIYYFRLESASKYFMKLQACRLNSTYSRYLLRYIVLPFTLKIDRQ